MLRLEDLSISALPWQDGRIFADLAQSRPLYRGPETVLDDPVARSATRLEGPVIRSLTDIRGADRLTVSDGLVTLEGEGSFALPRLRIAGGVPLLFNLVLDGDVGSAVHVLHLSGGRRAGGGSVHVLS